MLRSWIFVLVAIPLVACQAQQRDAASRPTEFARRIEVLSEPGGYFDTDNLISNERSYLHVVGELAARGVRGGAYLGVGPDQNFSYIAAVEPDVAYIVDIRRDNMLLHLLYKALFELAPQRVEFLAGLFGRAGPEDPANWTDANIGRLIAYIEETLPDSASITTARRRADSTIATFGVVLDSTDWAIVDRFHRTFISAGVSLRFTSFGRAPRPYYPTHRDLLLERDAKGRQVNYLASRGRYRIVRSLQLRDAVIPVVGDLAGPRALRAIARELQLAELSLSAFYVSNVEFYLFRSGTFEAFVGNLASFPLTDDAVIIRSVFRGGVGGPYTRDGIVYYSSQHMASVESMMGAYGRGELRSYRVLVRQ